MTAIVDPLRVTKKFDRRIKLSPKDKKDIVRLYKLPEWSHRKLAKQYGVSRRLIQFVLNPEKLKENIERRKENGGSKHYYDKDKWRVYMSNHRSYKKRLLKEGKI